MTLRERYYHKYEHLAKYYADKIWNTNNIGMDKEDVIQEFRLKLYESIKMYAKKWSEFKKTGMYKPVPIEQYLRSSLIAKSRDFIKGINKMKMIPMSQINFDFGMDQNISLDSEKLEYVVDGDNILELFPDAQRKMLKFHLKGMDKNKIDKIFKNNPLDPNVCNVLNLQALKEYLTKNPTEVREYVVTYQED